MWHADCVLIKYGGRSNALPPLDWPLPSQFDQYELRIEVQPRPHHRAHYETEGSRGAVKATPTGHPVVKVKYKSAATGGCRYRNRIVSKHWNKILGDVMFFTVLFCPQLCGFTERKPLSLQVFVGTADDRSIRPHPFYQIHRWKHVTINY